jgi:hypothetical protein
MALVSGLLLVCLAFLEFPEMSSLRDDTSNDFTILTTDSGHLPVIGDRRVTGSQSKRPALILVAARERPSASDCSLRRAPQDLLALYSLLRT